MFDPANLDRAFYDDPYPVYAQLRRETPVYRCPDGSYFLTRYADCHDVYRDPQRFSSDKRRQFQPNFGNGPLYRHHTTSLVFSDPPLHTQVRRAIGNALSPKTVAAMESRVTALIECLLDAIAERGTFDGIDDYAGAIPVEVIGNLLQIPSAEREPLRRWSLAILGALEAHITPAQRAAGNAAVNEFIAYLEDFVARRRARLQAGDDDVLARLLRWEADGFRLEGETLYHQCVFILNAGHETTTNLIGNAILALLQHPAQRAVLRERPQLIDSAVEEVLRFESPNQLGNRLTTVTVDIGGVPIPAGTVLTLCIGAANRDPARFDAADTFDIARADNPHLAFGGGPHTCAGLAVARMEGRIALQGLFTRFPDLRLDGTPQRARRARFRGLNTLPLRTA